MGRATSKGFARMIVATTENIAGRRAGSNFGSEGVPALWARHMAHGAPPQVLHPKRAGQASVVFFLRSASAPRPAKPASIMTQVEASGTEPAPPVTELMLPTLTVSVSAWAPVPQV
jgi:hypothetical protein